jgi:hypothetical protein
MYSRRASCAAAGMQNPTTSTIAASLLRRSAVNDIIKSSAAVDWVGDSEMA